MVELRRAELSDVAGILELWLEADVEPSHTDDPDSLARLIAHDAAAVIVASSDGDIVGSVIAGWDGWRGSIYRLAVAPAQRRKGLGRKLVSAAEAHLKENGAVRLQAIVAESDPRATAFWRTSDWEQQVRRVRFVKG